MTATASATMRMTAWVNWTNAANATVRAPSSNAVATKSKTARATATATSLTCLANVAAIAWPTWTTTASATTKTTASEPWTRAGYATAPARCTNAVATTSKKANAIASEARKTPSGCAEAGATSTWTLTASATTKTLASARWTLVGSATDLAPFTLADAPCFPWATAIATETKRTPSVNVAAIAQKTSMPTAFATTSTIVWARWTLVACATARGRCTTAVATTCPKATAIATATKWMPWAFVRAHVTPIRMETVCATTSTTASARSTLAAFATGPDRFTNADAQTSPKATATAAATNWTPSACAAAHARPTTTEMAFVTTWTTAWAPSTHAASAMDQGAVLECGCYNPIPGFCDCDWNQYDALGVCGGTCLADVDGDGVCDDVDDCVGAFDACGICNGPGDVYECGCDDIPDGDCDCNGNHQLDALGVCGGTCNATSSRRRRNDGVCDDVDNCVGILPR